MDLVGIAETRDMLGGVSRQRGHTRDEGFPDPSGGGFGSILIHLWRC
ncbi:hypothetical protein [Micromonospora globbae]|uniref:Uncharacterized protein n=1 Tax=Micromonospora globbae TaxID=1894969 RepID=A0ABZ1S8T6_9ACTN|nr:hypothetical protein [Micromonospora globbae]